jgi:hypothetical protein
MLARSRNAARAAVLDWMNEQGARGQLCTNSQAPGWVAYEVAEREFAAAVDALGTTQSNDNLIIQTTQSLEMTFRIVDGELYATLKAGEELSVISGTSISCVFEHHGDHLIHVRRV